MVNDGVVLMQKFVMFGGGGVDEAVLSSAERPEAEAEGLPTEAAEEV